MTVIQLQYRHCDRHRPHYLKHSQVEVLAGQVRNQLVAEDDLAIPLEVLSGITALHVNGITVELSIDTAHEVHDEAGQPVLGVCEYDPNLPDTALVSVSPVSEGGSPSLVLSTLGHELGHACFEVPGWIYEANQGPDLFASAEQGSKIYRTTTEDPEHLTRPSSLDQQVRFAELRANEFMGSLLVPRLHLRVAATTLAQRMGIAMLPGPSLHPNFPSVECCFIPPNQDSFDCLAMQGLYLELADYFGVSSRFIEVRLQHYGFITPSNLTH